MIAAFMTSHNNFIKKPPCNCNATVIWTICCNVTMIVVSDELSSIRKMKSFDDLSQSSGPCDFSEQFPNIVHIRVSTYLICDLSVSSRYSAHDEFTLKSPNCGHMTIIKCSIVTTQLAICDRNFLLESSNDTHLRD